MEIGILCLRKSRYSFILKNLQSLQFSPKDPLFSSFMPLRDIIRSTLWGPAQYFFFKLKDCHSWTTENFHHLTLIVLIFTFVVCFLLCIKIQKNSLTYIKRANANAKKRLSPCKHVLYTEHTELYTQFTLLKIFPNMEKPLISACRDSLPLL